MEAAFALRSLAGALDVQSLIDEAAMIRNLVLDPGVRCLVSGLGVLSFPFIWRARQRGETLPSELLIPIRWFARAAGAAVLLAGGVVADSQIARGPYHGGQLIMLGASVLPLSDIVARLAVGPAVMEVSSAQRRKYWHRTTQVGLMLVAAGILLHMGWARLP